MQEILEKTIRDKTLLEWARNYESFHRNRIASDVEFVLSLQEAGKILNIGGAPYVLEHTLKRYPAYAITTIDLDCSRFSELITELQIPVKTFDIENGDFISLKNDIGEFNLILLCEVFEHLRINLIDTIENIRTLLTTNGRLYLTTPNGLSLLGLLQIFPAFRTGPNPVSEWRKLKELGHMGHVREYSMKEVCEILRHCGFRVEKKFYRNLRYGKSKKGFLYYTLCLLFPFLSRELVIVARKN